MIGSAKLVSNAGDSTVREQRAVLETHRQEVKERLCELSCHLEAIEKKINRCKQEEQIKYSKEIERS